MRKFKELGREEKLTLLTAWVNGHPIEFKGASGAFSPKTGPNWYGGNYYRLAYIPDTIDWSHASEEYNFMARDRDGKVELYREQPIQRGAYWADRGRGHGLKATCFTSFKEGTVPWNESLVCRPS